MAWCTDSAIKKGKVYRFRKSSKMHCFYPQGYTHTYQQSYPQYPQSYISLFTTRNIQNVETLDL